MPLLRAQSDYAHVQPHIGPGSGLWKLCHTLPIPRAGARPRGTPNPSHPHLQGQRLVCAHLQENGRSLASLGAIRNGQGGGWVPPTPAPTHCAWSACRGAWETAGSLAVNYYAIPVPVSYAHAQPCWSGGSRGGAGPLSGPVQARSGVLGAGTGQAPGLGIRGRDRLSRLVSFFKPSDWLPC